MKTARIARFFRGKKVLSHVAKHVVFLFCPFPAVNVMVVLLQMSNTDKLRFTQPLPKIHYYEYRLAELVKWLLVTRHTPDIAKKNVRDFYDHYTKFMRFDYEPYGIRWIFENEKIVFIRESTGEEWGTVN